jgi:hypothetical protein
MHAAVQSAEALPRKVKSVATAVTVAPRFSSLDWGEAALPDGAPELEWLAQAMAGNNVAALWQAPLSLVAPLSYRKHPALDGVRARFFAQGVPVRMRRSGGGVVPMGPGVLNLSLVYQVDGMPGDLADAVYEHLCGVLIRALAAMGVAAETSAVPGSFCDGRFNLAVRTPAGLKKIAGTAQYWRGTGANRAVLAHAVLLVDCDVDALTAHANDFESAIDSGRVYESAALATVAHAWKMAHPGEVLPADFSGVLARRIVATLMK